MTSAISGMAGMIHPHVVSGASMRQPPAQRMANLFDKIDTAGTGSINKAQFEHAFQTLNPPASLQSMGANAVWSQLDSNNTGSVSKQQFVSGMGNLPSQLQGGKGGDGDSDVDASAAGAGSQSTDLAAALRSLESILGGGPSSSSQVGGTGGLFNVKA